MEQYLIQLLVILIIIGIPYLVGNYIEKKHFASIQKREKQFLDMPIVNEKDLAQKQIQYSELYCSQIVLSYDLFKKTVAGIVDLFGGRLFTYESLLDRARREVILRLKENASLAGIHALVNLRIETSVITGGNSSRSIGSVEVFAYCSGVIIKK